MLTSPYLQQLMIEEDLETVIRNSQELKGLEKSAITAEQKERLRELHCEKIEFIATLGELNEKIKELKEELVYVKDENELLEDSISDLVNENEELKDEIECLHHL